jgi:hypothetical protein
MERFIGGLVVGAIGGGLTWIFATATVASIVGVVLVLLVWFGLEVLDAL